MSNAFAAIAFSDAARAAQDRLGSRAANQRLEQADLGNDVLGAEEARFIAARDNFYMASVNHNGWPYLQHRGGPRGFLRVVDERTLGFADFRGNRQYISIGNIAADDRVALILVDYAAGARLKILGHAHAVSGIEHASQLAQLRVPDYAARIEHGILIRVEAFDWNCPQHIVPRYTVEQIQPMLEGLQARVQELEAQLAELQAV
jgi:predicted pyridoxine 5'-phosphate oxidase superfamily flavin-nucleotide-binding protein